MLAVSRTRTEKRGTEEALDLYPLPAEFFDGQDSDVVSRHKPESCDDDVANADLEEPIPG